MTVPRRLLLSAVVGLVVAGCRSVSTAVSDGSVTVTSGAGVLRLENGSALPVNYFLLAGDAVPLIDWAPCAGPGCPVIPAHGTVTVPHGQVAGLSASTTEVITYWWHWMPDWKGGFLPDSIRALVTPL